MTVAELIRRLEIFDPTMQVVVSDIDSARLPDGASLRDIRCPITERVRSEGGYYKLDDVTEEPTFVVLLG